jgi:rhamnogalacturonyl hydrolase YesR
MQRGLFYFTLLLLSFCGAAGPSTSAANSFSEKAEFRRWGEQTLASIDQQFRTADGELYVEQIDLAHPGAADAKRTSYLWPAGVQLSALVTAAQVDPQRYAPAMNRYADAIVKRYRSDANDVVGLSVLPELASPDRYYDDNAWIVLGLADAYELTHDARQLDHARELMRFVLSGEDQTLAGGIWWRENRKTSKNTCSNAPAIVGCLRLHQLTHGRSDLDAAQRLYAWTNAHLQDPGDGLYWDNVRLNGRVNRTKWTYNTALMLRANVLLLSATGEQRYRDEARRLAAAAIARWVDPNNGAIRDEAAFAHLLVDALLELHAIDLDPRWREAATGAIRFLHEHARDATGWYGRRWDAPRDAKNPPRLIDQASAARAYFRAARG